MPCSHKFQEYLTLERLDFEPTTLIVGTFNPAWPESNYAEWFYGRTDNNYFWDILPRITQPSESGLRNRTRKDWVVFCKKHGIALTDLVSCIEDAERTDKKHSEILGKYTDSAIASKFKKYKTTDIIAILKKFPTIENVYLTTTVNSCFWQNLWHPVVKYCTQNKKLCRQLMTPSKGARFFMKKGSGIKMPDFIYNDWKNKWQVHE